MQVLGALEELPELAAREGVEMRGDHRHAGASHRVRRRAVELCRSAGVQALTVPSYDDLVSGKVTVSQVRHVELDDLLGRDPVVLDSAGLREWLAGRTVLVTGAGGSIGSELCRQIARFEPARLVLFEQNEYALYRWSRSSRAQPGATRLACVIGDVEDRGRASTRSSPHYRPRSSSTPRPTSTCR